MLNFDGWANVLKKIGGRKDPRSGASFVSDRDLGENELASLYGREGVVRRVVNLPVDEMMRQGFTIHSSDLSSEEIDGIFEEFKRLKAHRAIKRLLRWDRVFGGAVMVINANDGLELKEELNEGAIRRVEWLRVFDRFRVNSLMSSVFSDDLNVASHPSVISITPIRGAMTSVHTSRCEFLFGQDVADFTRQQLDGWGESVIQIAFREFRQLASAYTSTEFILEDFIQVVLNVENLSQMIASKGSEDITKRLEILDISRHVANMWLLDKGEEYQKHSSTVTGIEKLIIEFQKALCTVTGIPHTLLTGQTTSGLGAEGKNELEHWYDSIKSAQEEILAPVIERIVRMIMLSSEGPTRGRVPESWSIKFPSLKQLSDKQKADILKTNAEADQIYLDSGVVAPNEVARGRFDQDDSPYDIDFGMTRGVDDQT
jgi:phage-related protein (TIGR01555 family)